MLKSYFIIAWRSIARHKIPAAINVTGLALAMTCCLFILLWVQDEKSVDNFHANGKNLYVAYETIKADGKRTGSYSLPLRYDSNITRSLLDDIKDAVPEVKGMALYTTGYELPWGHAETFRVGDKLLKLEGSRAGKDFFTMFSYRLLAGNPQTALSDISSIAISRTMAAQFFGSPQQALGKTLRYENRLDLVVTAVFENLPPQSSFKFEFLINWEAQKKGLLEYGSNGFYTCLQLAETANLAGTEAKINRFLQTRLDKKQDGDIEIGLQPFADRYLHDVFVNGKPATGRITYVRIFSGVALFILVIACINFMNLATARATKRAKEIGLRKVVGSTRGHLIAQFFSEALLLTLGALAISFALLYLLLPAFNLFTGKEMVPPLAQPVFWKYVIGLLLITGLVAGSYPALYLSSLHPIRTLKGVVHFSQGAVRFRKSLTVFQFVLSILLIIATIVIVRQVSYVQHTHLGYDRENLVYIRIEGALANKNSYLLFKDRALGMPGIAMVDRSTETPHAMGFLVTDPVNWEGKEKNASVGFKPASVGFDFVRLMHLQLAEGRDFSALNPTDSTDAFMVNEEAVKEMGLKNPIGKWVSAWKKKGHIIGVLKDYHTHSLHEPIKPVVIDVKENENFGVIMVRTQAGKTKAALASLSEVYKDINPGYPFAWQFVDEEYNKLYRSERIMSRLSVLFATLAIIISCLGLLGLVIFSAEQRVKEIGIRKVLGASARQLVALFSKDFLQLMLIAFLIAAPLGWFVMNSWLKDFAYRVAVSWWIFVLAGLASLLVALLTVGYQAVKAAIANPAKSLRTE